MTFYYQGWFGRMLACMHCQIWKAGSFSDLSVEPSTDLALSCRRGKQNPPISILVGELRPQRATESSGSQGAVAAAAVQAATARREVDHGAVLSAATLTVVSQQPASRDKVTASSIFQRLASAKKLRILISLSPVIPFTM